MVAVWPARDYAEVELADAEVSAVLPVSDC